MRRPLLAILLVLPALAGCLGSGSTGQADPPAPDPLTIIHSPEQPREDEPVRFQVDDRLDADYTLNWRFGDGLAMAGSEVNHTYIAPGVYHVEVIAAGATPTRNGSMMLTVYDENGNPAQGGGDPDEDAGNDTNDPPATPASTIPHVLVGVPDSGFNVYHEVYRRPELTVHPCTYIEDYPCEIPALELTLDAPTWAEAFEADRDVWASIQPGDRYWIPGTNIVGAVCHQPYSGSTAAQVPSTEEDHCIISDSNSHGTGTSSSVLSENPDALLVVVEGNSGGAAYLTDGFYPLDVVSYSWGAAAPLAAGPLLAQDHVPFFVAASGNEGAFPVVLDSGKAHTSVITVGGADGASQTEPGYSGWKTMEYVSEYCRPGAAYQAVTGPEEDDYCGTSFSAPTLAGALSRAIWEMRQISEYTGSVTADGMVDPVLGVTKWDMREALNHSATYQPDSPFDDEPHDAPLVSPEYQWGWGYIARNEVPEILECILRDVCTERPETTVTYMESLWEARQAYSGESAGL